LVLFFESLLQDEQQQQLSQNIKRLALPEATSRIVDEIVKLIKK
jgi:UDP-N-acetylglucosamine--N-acetylmuramyl-(pentapeptide) pyrophosphoryl-undecaprenol N-acetylglucosamine transferase